jgi:hypothetical protein
MHIYIYIYERTPIKNTKMILQPLSNSLVVNAYIKIDPIKVGNRTKIGALPTFSALTTETRFCCEKVQ